MVKLKEIMNLILGLKTKFNLFGNKETRKFNFR